MPLLVLLLAGCPGKGDTAVTPLTREELLDPASCQECHPDHYREWSGSMHAYATADPIFRAMNARGQRETDGALYDLCIRCHAPVAVKEGLTTDGLNMDELPESMQGITCYACHGVTSVGAHFNNGLEYADDGVLRGGIRDPLETAAHPSEWGVYQDRTVVTSSDMCGSCHDVRLPNELMLERSYQEWTQTIFATPENGLQQTCGNCHMDGRDDQAADVEGAPTRRVHNHMFPGVDTAIIPWPEAEAQEAAVQKALDPTVLPALLVCTGAKGVEVRLDLENVAAGHSFPSGAAQDRRAWVQAQAWAGGEKVWEVGVVPEGQALADTPDPDRWQLGDQMIDADGNPTHMFWETASIESNLLIGLTPDVNNHYLRTWYLGEVRPERVEVRLFIRAFDVDVIEDLIHSGDLDEAYRGLIPTRELANAAKTWEGLVEPCP